MSSSIAEELTRKKCVPCEGGVPKLSEPEARKLLEGLDGWSLSQDHNSISKSWTVKNFMAGIEFLDAIAKVAEDEGHHPDLHLTGYRNVRAEIMTHAIGGLSENDFILAAKIDRLPVKLKG
jgi:4a-hydroxytetrahydrobiopterin dehydratase